MIEDNPGYLYTCDYEEVSGDLVKLLKELLRRCEIDHWILNLFSPQTKTSMPSMPVGMSRVFMQSKVYCYTQLLKYI